MAKEKMWSVLVHLTGHIQENNHYDTLPFDDGMWENNVLRAAVDAGVNTIVLDVGDGIEYATHPEIAIKGAWTRRRVREEVRRCRDLGITLIPKLNFAPPHHKWLGEYRRMVSTNIYYRLANDLIKEAYELFEKPEYIHLGFDEEDARHVQGNELAIYRQKELYWHDLNFFYDCVADTGATPWVWSCPLYRHFEEYGKHVGVDDAVLSPWYYNAFRPEHWTPVESRAEYVAYYNEGMYKDMGIKFVEEDPYLVNFRNVTPGVIEKGYKLIPCASVFNRCDWNTYDLVEYFHNLCPDEQILGYMTAPWVITQPTEKALTFYEESFRFLKEAKNAFYKG